MRKIVGTTVVTTLLLGITYSRTAWVVAAAPGAIRPPAMSQVLRLLSSPGGELTTYPLGSAALTMSPAWPPFEHRLALGTTHLLKSSQRGWRLLMRYLRWCARRWARWMMMACIFVLIAPLVAVLDRSALRTWRSQGFAAFRISVLLAMLVYVRLLVDRSAPLIGKGLLVLAVAYGVAPLDLVPDSLLPFGFVDDVIAVTVASRCFMRLCPDGLVARHARRATRTWHRVVWRRAAERQPLP